MSPDRPEPSTLIADVLTDPDAGRGRLPALLGLLDVGDRQVRLGAATALCVVAVADPETAPSIARRLADRASNDELEARLALDYLAAQFPSAVGESLDAGLTGSNDEDVSGPTGKEGESEDGGEADERSAMGTDDDPSANDTNDDTASEVDTDDGTGPSEAIESTSQPDSPLTDDADWLPLIEYESAFESLSVLAPRDRRRYCDAYRTLGIADDEELAVALRFLRRPEADDDGFLTALGPRLDDWQAVGDLAGVVTLYDWAQFPRLWAATEYVDETLADRGRLPPREAIWHAGQVARTVSMLHERGVVHGGLDPRNVVYYGNALDEDERESPLLDNVGLLRAYRQHANPSTYLDPRYAAPEYYDRRYGRIDDATDIYHLGAVCYRLLTGSPPYPGDFESVREQVLNASPPTPSDVVDVPPAVDTVVGKAMGTRKLTRYETAAHVAQELRALGEPPRDNGR